MLGRKNMHLVIWTYPLTFSPRVDKSGRTTAARPTHQDNWTAVQAAPNCRSDERLADVSATSGCMGWNATPVDASVTDEGRRLQRTHREERPNIAVTAGPKDGSASAHGQGSVLAVSCAGLWGCGGAVGPSESLPESSSSCESRERSLLDASGTRMTW